MLSVKEREGQGCKKIGTAVPNKNSMVYKIFKAIEENPIKNDFVNTCKKYLEILKIKTGFEEIATISKIKLKQILRGKSEL